MTRLMIFVVVLIVMAVLAIQNQETTALTILGNQQTPEIPFGLLLVGAFSIGAVLTLLLYGLVGMHRPPKSTEQSKYRPMGRRVPYPDSPGSRDLPPSGPPTDAVSTPYETAGSTSYKTAGSTSQGSSSSTAFVSEPASSPSAATPTQNSYRTPGVQGSAPYSSTSEPSNVSQSAFSPPIFSEGAAKDAPDSAVGSPTPEKKKSRFNPLNRQATQKPKVEKRVGDNWGELRTAEHINSWEADEVRRASGNAKPNEKRGLLDLIGIGGASANGATAKGAQQPAEQLADDIAAGWNEPIGEYPYEEGAYAGGPYRDELDSGWEQGYRTEDTASGSQRRVYHDGIYSDGDYPEGPYGEAYAEEAYAGPYEEPDESGEGPEEGVYEADYRVIVPPSRPLEEGILDEGPMDRRAPEDEPVEGPVNEPVDEPVNEVEKNRDEPYS